MSEVSIVTPTYNCGDFIQETYESLRQQTFSGWEWVVIDDCSRDQTFAAIQKMAALDNRIRVFRNSSNLGAAASRNISMENSASRFVAFLDGDDVWFPEKLKSQLAFMKENDCAISFTPFVLLNESGHQKSEKKWDSNAPDIIDYKKLLKKKATFGCSTVIVDREKTGSFQMPNLRTGQDYATWLSLLRNGNIALKYPEPLSAYRSAAGSLSSNKFKKAARQWQIYRELENIGFAKSFYYFLNYSFRAFIRP